MGEVPCVDIKKRIMGELVQGETMANQLQALLRDPGNDRSDLAHELVAKILGSFTESLSVLGSPHPPEGGSKKRSPDSKEKRGCYKRKKSFQTRATVASTIEDDYSWRKYGQKEILNSKYPRSYFRCTHKYNQNCKAVKQVQKMEENPRMYEITYIGVHTCTDGAALAVKEEAKEDAKSELTDIDIDSLLIGAGDFPEGSNLSMFGY